MSDLTRLLPDGATHCVVEERLHRGNSVYAVIAIVPNGSAIAINGYSTKALADSTAIILNDHLVK